MAKLNCVIYREGGIGADELEARLLATGHVGEARTIESHGELTSGLEAYRPDFLLAVLDDHKETALTALAALGKLSCPLVCTGPASASDLIIRSMRIGASEYLPFGLAEAELTTLIGRLTLLAPARAARNPKAAAKVIAVLGVKGGAGSTVVASQLAASISKSGRRTSAVDLDLLGGSLALYYDLQLRYSIADLAREESFDASFLRSVVGIHRSGVEVLSAPHDPLQCEHVAPGHIRAVFEVLRSDSDIVVVDLGKRWDPIAMTALQNADLIVLVMSVDLQTLDATTRTMALLEGLEISRERIRLVANRYDKDQKALEHDAESFLGSKVDFRIPNDYPAVTRCIGSGDTLQASAPKSAVAAAYTDFSREVHKWLGLTLAEPQPDTAARSWSVRGWFAKGTS